MKKIFAFILTLVLATTSIVAVFSFVAGQLVCAHGHGIDDFSDNNTAILIPADLLSHSVPEHVYFQNYVPQEKTLKHNIFAEENFCIEQCVERYIVQNTLSAYFKQSRIELRRWNI